MAAFVAAYTAPVLVVEGPPDTEDTITIDADRAASPARAAAEREEVVVGIVEAMRTWRAVAGAVVLRQGPPVPLCRPRRRICLPGKGARRRSTNAELRHTTHLDLTDRPGKWTVVVPF